METAVHSASNIARMLQVADPSTDWRELPEWLAFSFELGERVAVAFEARVTTCAVLIPPVRSFAAVFAATGAVLGVACNADSIPDVDAHFAALSSLTAGSAIVVKMGERIYSASFQGVVHRDGATFLRIEYNGMTQYLPQSECHRVQVGTGGKRSLPTGKPTRSRTAAGIQDILGEYADDFLAVPTVDAVLVGQISLLTEELTSVSLRAPEQQRAVPLAALLRASRFLPDGGISRSLLLSDRVAEFAMPVDDTPHVVIFDGARALSRYRSEFPNSSWIAVLDRCSTSIDQGVDVANEEFAVRRGEAPYSRLLSIPDGAEFQAFERGR
jgi:hypothetical protein